MAGDDRRIPDAEPFTPEGEHSRVADKQRFSGKPRIEGVPDEEGIDDTDLEDRLDEDPEEAANRRDVPDTPENSREARTEDA
jgi:hypothetical protein